jgi:hypothetical protein
MGSVYNRKQQLQHDVVSSAKRWYRGCVAQGQTDEEGLPGELQKLFRRVRTLEAFGMTSLSSGQAL